jgi:NADH-quinone oxidoreductase subunit C
MMLDYPVEKIERLRARYGSMIQEIVTENTNFPIVYVDSKNIIEFLQSLRKEDGFEYNFLSDLTAIDMNPPTDQIQDYGLGTVTPTQPGVPRFEMVYQMLSMQHKDRLRVKVRLEDGQSTPSLVGLWDAANWLEREAYDMYGIKFDGHPNLRRIFLDDRWVGYPQRKDYPIKRYQRYEGAAKMEDLGLE